MVAMPEQVTRWKCAIRFEFYEPHFGEMPQTHWALREAGDATLTSLRFKFSLFSCFNSPSKLLVLSRHRVVISVVRGGWLDTSVHVFILTFIQRKRKKTSLQSNEVNCSIFSLDHLCSNATKTFDCFRRREQKGRCDCTNNLRQSFNFLNYWGPVFFLFFSSAGAKFY